MNDRTTKHPVWQSAPFALAQHVFICVSGEHIVGLDLKADRYWALPLAQTQGMEALVRGWPKAPEGLGRAGSGSPEASLPTLQIETLLGSLHEAGILVKESPASQGKDATPVAAIPATGELLSDDEVPSPGPLPSGWVTFARTSAFAKFAVRVCPFERVIRRVRRRKERSAGRAALDAERVRALVEAFMRFRVFAFSSRDECLFDSLALLEFLARHEVHPDWVFGVQTRPFAAHCWIQLGEIVCNDTVEHVSGYTPIMVV